MDYKVRARTEVSRIKIDYIEKMLRKMLPL